jgi:mono/diheme cytochrome c family protein
MAARLAAGVPWPERFVVGCRKTREIEMWTVLVSMIALTVLPTALGGPQEVVAAADGRGLFVTYCASCHGVSGRGDGPSAEEFRHRPADLTQFAKQNGGVFNDVAIHRVVDGRTVKAHGTMEMPVWGDAFKWRQGLDESAINVRIEAIVRYVRSIQERAGH